MAKITKTQLKGIVKECLVEILSEGLSVSEDAPLVEAKRRKKSSMKLKAEEQRLKEHRRKLETRVADTVSVVTDDPIMQAILSDTAKTTLQEQTQNEPPSSRSGGNFQNYADLGSSSAGINLDSIFETPSKSWADIAFVETKS